MRVSEFIKEVEALAATLRGDGRKGEAKLLLAQKSAFRAVLKGLDIADMDMEAYCQLREDPRLSDNLRSRFYNSLYVTRVYAKLVGDSIPAQELPTEVPTREEVEASIVGKTIQLDGVRLAQVPVDELGTYNPALGLEENYRQLYLAYALEKGARDRAEQKVYELAGVVGSLAKLTH